MPGDPGDPTEAAVVLTEVDQVVAAREWLRRHGVDPDVMPEAAQASRRASSGAHDGESESGYARSRRSSSTGSSGRSLSSRRARGRPPTDPDADGEVAAGSEGERVGALDPDADPEEIARGIVLRKLSAQARTRVELERALQERDVPEEAAAAVLDRLTEVGLVDDTTFAHDWVSSRQQRRHLSKTALRRELQTKGVDRDVIDDALAGVEGADEHHAALDLVRRRAATMGGLSREVAYRRLAGVLARRGFSSSVTTQVLSEVLAGWTEV